MTASCAFMRLKPHDLPNTLALMFGATTANEALKKIKALVGIEMSCLQWADDAAKKNDHSVDACVFGVSVACTFPQHHQPARKKPLKPVVF